MKKAFILLILVLTNKSYGQQDFEKKIYLELNGRTSFFEVTNRYQIINDTIYHTNSGFYIFPEYDH